MCGRFTLKSSPQAIAKQFQLFEVLDLQPRYNIAPSQPVLSVITSRDTGRRISQFLQWGLIPSWAKDPSIGNRMINARSETVAQKPSFRGAFRRHRCLVVADGYYEWQKVGSGKQPHFIHLQSGEPFGFAGLYEHWQDENGNELDTCTILTCEPNELMARIHNRMPVIIAPNHYEPWLDPDNDDTASLTSLLRSYPAHEMDQFPVSRLVNSPRNEDPRCIEPAGDAER